MSFQLSFDGRHMTCISDGSTEFWSELIERLHEWRGWLKIVGTLRGFELEVISSWIISNRGCGLELDDNSEEDILVRALSLQFLAIMCGNARLYIAQPRISVTGGEPSSVGQRLIYKFLKPPGRVLEAQSQFTRWGFPAYLLCLPPYAGIVIGLGEEHQLDMVCNFLRSNTIPLHIKIIPDSWRYTSNLHLPGIINILHEMVAASLHIGYYLQDPTELMKIVHTCRCPLSIGITGDNPDVILDSLLALKPRPLETAIRIIDKSFTPRVLSTAIIHFDEFMRETGKAVDLLWNHNRPDGMDVFIQTKRNQGWRRVAALVFGMDKFFGVDRHEEIKELIVRSFVVDTLQTLPDMR